MKGSLFTYAYTMEYVLCIALFSMGLLLLVKGADEFIDAALWFARRFGLSELIIGATIVSVGTTLPETVVSVTAAAHGNNGIAYGNAIGSVICNTGLIVALVLLLRPPQVDQSAFRRGTAFFFVAAAIYIASAVFFWGIPRPVAVLLLLLYGAYIITSLRQGKRGTGSRPGQLSAPVTGTAFSALTRMLLSAAVLFYGSHLMVENAEKFAFWLALPEEVIALTVVALGTSLPEFVTAILAIRRGHGELSVGNVLGANFFNIVLVSGAASLIDPLVVDALALRSDIVIMLACMLLFTLPLLVRKRASRLQGAALLGIYLFYVLALFR